MRFGKILEQLPRVEERKDDLFMQLWDLAMIADKLGMGKGAEFIRKVTTKETPDTKDK